MTAPRSTPGRLAVVFLRGGADGLSAVVPAGDGAYHDARPGIDVPESAVLDLDGTFGFHPALAPLHGLYQDARLAIVHAAGNPAGSRSHFDAQDYMEQGTDHRQSDARGWATRHFQQVGTAGLFDAVAISANVPGSLRGSGALSIPSLAQFGLGGRAGLTADYDVSLRFAYFGDQPIEQVGTSTLDAIEAIEDIGAPSGRHPFDDAATLLAAGLGVQVITLDMGGWDTHDQMGGYQGGRMTGLLATLAGQLSDFQSRLDASGQDDVTTIVMSEFGRRVAKNGSGGLDHGWAGPMMVFGGATRGGRVITDWPGLRPGDLERGDLVVTTDYRDVLWEVLREVLGNPDPGAVFTGHVHTPVGLFN